MKRIALICSFASALVLSSCNKKAEDHSHDGHSAHAQDATATSPNEKLYNEVMKVHDEVMPKMNDIHKLKMTIRERLEKDPTISQAERLRLDAMYAKLDSANEGMMVWMREFRPLPDSVGEEKAKAYLENEMTRVQKVRENMLKAIEAAEKE